VECQRYYKIACLFTLIIKRTFANAECKSRSSKSCHSVKREEQVKEGEEGNSDGEDNEQRGGHGDVKVDEVGTERDDDEDDVAEKDEEEEEEGAD
jgi:hypothetical protein